MNVLLTGRPGCGKTTLIMEFLKQSNLKANGFFTREIREKGIRKGFAIEGLDGRKGTLSHVDFKSPFKVSKYYVNLGDLKSIGVESILKGIKEKTIIVIDEIGKMELFSEKFKEAVLKALETDKVLGTILEAENEFANKIKERKDVTVLHVTKANHVEIIKKIKNLLAT